MKILDFRKYIFSYVFVFLYFLQVIFYDFSHKYMQQILQPGKEPPYIPDNYFIIALVCTILWICCSVALVIEIVLREFVIKKFFPNLKSPLKFHIPDKVNKILSVIFYIFFIPVFGYYIWILISIYL